jgi:hypothetical protein
VSAAEIAVAERDACEGRLELIAEVLSGTEGTPNYTTVVRYQAEGEALVERLRALDADLASVEAV